MREFGRLTTSQLSITARIEAWANESIVKHRRECTEKVCGAKSKIWWIVRHPKINPIVANKDAKTFVVFRQHVCGVMLERLESQQVPWINQEGFQERQVYSLRTPQEIAVLLGRATYSERMPSEEEINNPFPEVQFPATKSELNEQLEAGMTPEQIKESRARRDRRRAAQRAEQTSAAQRQSAGVGDGMGAAVDALSRRHS